MKKKVIHKQNSSTSWEPVQKWYNTAVGEGGHYYHKQIVIPNLKKLMAFKKGDSLLDLACGQGILGRSIPKEMEYTGVDISPSLVESARRQDNNPHHRYCVGDITENLGLEKKDFSHAAIILALQNIESGDDAIRNASLHLRKRGSLLLVLNHPCFRIPRQSSWGIDEAKKIQYRRMDMYMSPMKIPIAAHPGMGQDSPSTETYHHPLSTITKWLSEAGFLIQHLEEWCSDKISTGKAAKMENRSRAEFPLFLAIKAIKDSTPTAVQQQEKQ